MQNKVSQLVIEGKVSPSKHPWRIMKKTTLLAIDLKKEVISVALSGLMMVVVAMILTIAT